VGHRRQLASVSRGSVGCFYHALMLKRGFLMVAPGCADRVSPVR